MTFALVSLVSALASAASPAFETTFETSKGLRTGRLDEVVRICHALADAHPREARCTQFGVTPEQRPMLALVLSGDGTLDPAEAMRKHRPVLLAQGGIHAGEIDGKDAVLLFARELLDGRGSAREVLAKVTVVLVPIFNVDGHERFGPWHRPNQQGPEESGWRVTSQNLNLNRDYAKADTPEMRAMLGLLNAWDPVLYVDLHVTDGAKFQPEVSVQVQPFVGPSPLAQQGAALSKAVAERLAQAGHLPLADFYPEFTKQDDPLSGFAMSEASPRFSQGYWASRNRLGMLVETHSWKPYATRVAVTLDTLRATAAETARQGEKWLALERAADRDVVKLPGAEVVLETMTGLHSRRIDFPGYAYERVPSEVSGGLWTRYDVTTPQVWRIPLFDQVVPKVVARAPLGGYVVPAGFAQEIGERLTLHGITFEVLGAAKPKVAIEAFRATKVKLAPSMFEGRLQISVEGGFRPEVRDLAAGSIYVPVTQPRGALAIQLLEPSGPDSFLSWGFFNASFEQKESMEGYVTEEVAREMLAKDPALRAEIAKRLADDPEFQKSPAARLGFFEKRARSWDERMNLVPVFRVAGRP